MIDSKDADKIATADIYYSSNTTKKSSADDKEILKASPNADAKTKFTVTVNGTRNIKIKAVLTYDNEGNLIDYFSSYNGVEATNGTYDIDFGNNTDNEAGFAGGSGTEDDPYIISAPRHFVNINKQDDQGNYLYLDKSFTQTEDIDFSHLTGLKIVSATDDKDITVEKTNEKAPFYNDGYGITPIGKNEKAPFYNDGYGITPIGKIGDLNTAEGHQNCFNGNYDGNNKTIDGIMFVNPDTEYISLFPGFTGYSLKNINIGSNSIIYLDKILNKQSLFIGTITTWRNEKNIEEEENDKILIENCVNNCKIVLKNSNIGSVTISGISCYDQCKPKYTNCINNANISVTNNEIGSINIAGCFINTMESYVSVNNCINNGIIKVANNKMLELEGYSVNSVINVSGLFLTNVYYSSGSDPIIIPVDPNNPPIPIIIPVDPNNPPFSFPADPIHILFP